MKMTTTTEQGLKITIQDNKQILQKQNGAEKDGRDGKEAGKVRSKWKTTTNKVINSENNVHTDDIAEKWQGTAKQLIERQKSWKLIDGSVEDIRWSSADDCWKWTKRGLTLGNIGVIAICFCLLLGSASFCFRRFFKKETTTIVRVKPTSDLNTPFLAFTVCPEYHTAYKDDVLDLYNITVDDYRYKSKWYPGKNITPENAKEFFYNITYALDEVIEKIEISTMSLNESKIKLYPGNHLDTTYATFTTQYTDTYGRCYTMNATEKVLSLGITKVTVVTLMGVYVFLDHPGQHLHVNSRSKVYSDLGTKHYLDVHFDISINTWTESPDIPCNHTMNTRYDELLYQNLRHLLVSEFNCTVPFLPNEVSSKNEQTNQICLDPEVRKKSYDRYDLLKRNNGNKVCDNPCSTIQTYFGLFFKDTKYNGDKAYIKIYLQSMTTIKLTVMDYDAVDMVADIGGYTGLLLGMSAIHVSKLIFKSILKVVNAPRKKNESKDVDSTNV